MRVKLVLASACIAVALAAPVPGDLSGYWEINGQCSESGLFPYQFIASRHCGSSVLLAPVDREYTMQGDYALGSYQNGVLTAQVYGASCSAEGGNGILAGSCATSTGTSCTFGMMCVDGMCLTNLPAPVEGPQGFPNVDGTWTTSGGTCSSSFPGFSSTFNIIQCGYSLLVLPDTQGANTGAVSMGGHLMIGTTSGSTTQCEGVVTGSGVNASCFYNQAPACTVLLSR